VTSLWLVSAALVAGLVLAPVAALARTAFVGSDDLWRHLVTYVLPVATRDTLVLLAGVGALSATLGTSLAWLVTAYEFPGRQTLTWALLLPLAVPTYIIAYAYLDLLHPVGALQTTIREILGVGSPRDFRLPDVRSMTGCVLLLGFVLYPYVYLATRAMFLMQSANLIDAARTLGVSRSRVFLTVAVPLARPALAVGLSLTLMETLNDVGASEFLGVRTLAVNIYSTWATRADLPGAAQMALALLVVVMSVVVLEQRARRQRGYASDAQHPRPLRPERLRRGAAIAAVTLATLPVLVGFVVPAAYLLDAAMARIDSNGLSPAIVTEARNTVVVALVGTGGTMVAALLVAYAHRLQRSRLTAVLSRVASIGYAIPGVVLAIGLLPVVTSVNLWLLTSGVAIVIAYVIRFLTIGIGSVESGFSRVPLSVDAAARTLGDSPLGRLWRIHLPLTRPALATAALLVFVDCMKELPATLLLRPLGFETLATHLYGEAVRGTYEDAAIAALLIVVAGLIPVRLLARVAETHSVDGRQVSREGPPRLTAVV
jgi:iron(III) transport system permease protein